MLGDPVRHQPPAHEPVRRHTLVAFALMLVVIGITEAAICAVLDFFGKPATFARVVVTMQGVGAIAGGGDTPPDARARPARTSARRRDICPCRGGT